MAGQAIVRCAFLLMTIDAEAHRVIDDPLGYRHLREIAVASDAVDTGVNVR